MEELTFESILEQYDSLPTSVICEYLNTLTETAEGDTEEFEDIMEASIKGDSVVLRTKLYPLVEKALSKKENQKTYKEIIDRYMANNVSSYSTIGPSTKPVRAQSDVKQFVECLGLTEQLIRDTLSSIEGNNPGWKTNRDGSITASSWSNFNTPYNIGIVLSIRCFAKAHNEEGLNNGLLYLATNIYQFMFGKYYQYPPNEAVMAYTVANLSQRFKLKKSGTILAAIMDITQTCYNTHKSRIARGTDVDILKFINDATSRINSFMKKLRNEFGENIKNDNYLQSEHDDYSDEHFYEADNDSFAIDRITNKVLTNLVVNGPDRRLVELAALNSKVSVNILQTSVLTLISEDNREEIKQMIERLLSLYLTDNEDPEASIKNVATDKFYVYCIRLYRQSNTNNKNIIEIKKILDKWVVDLDLRHKVSTVGTLGNYRKAIFVFFIFTIEKLA